MYSYNMAFYKCKYFLGCLGAIILAEICAFPQSFAMKSNEDFGVEEMLYLDSHPYPMRQLDLEVLRLYYQVYLRFEEQDGGIFMNRVLQIGAHVTKDVAEARSLADSLMLTGESHMSSRAKLYYHKANFLLAEDCFYKNFKENTLSFTGRLAADDFLYEETIPQINWSLGESRKEICGYPCQDAEAEFRGRKYKVWFTESLPSSAGPWKLQGLPGVILAVDVDQGICSMETVKISSGKGAIYMTDYPYVRVTPKQYRVLQLQLLKDPTLFSFNHSSRSGWQTILSDQHSPQDLPKLHFLERL